MRKIANFLTANKNGYHIVFKAKLDYGTIMLFFLQPDNKLYSAVKKGFYFDTAQEAKNYFKNNINAIKKNQSYHGDFYIVNPSGAETLLK